MQGWGRPLSCVSPWWDTCRTWCPCLVCKDSHQQAVGVSLKHLEPSPGNGCADHGMVESKYLPVYPGRRIVLKVRKGRRRMNGWKLDESSAHWEPFWHVCLLRDPAVLREVCPSGSVSRQVWAATGAGSGVCSRGWRLGPLQLRDQAMLSQNPTCSRLCTLPLPL